MNNTVEEITSKLLTAYEILKPIEFIRNQYTLEEKKAYAVQDELI